MKKTKLARTFFYFYNLFSIIIVISISSCDSGKKESSISSFELPIDSNTTTKDSPIELNDFKVILAVDESFKMNETGELRVWIGATGVNVTFSQNMVQDETSIPATIGQYAKITPFAPDFEVYPSEMKCVRIDPSGSDIRFLLKPKKPGTLKVSANIELYNCFNCNCTPVPKTTATLSVIVKVNIIHSLFMKLQEMGAVVWNIFLNFWKAFIALLFAVLLFIIRRKIRKKTGFEDKND